MNTIIITEKDLVDFSEYECAHYFEHFIFDEFRLISKRSDCKVVYKVKINGDIHKVKYRMIQGDWYRDGEFSFRDTEESIEWIEKPHGEFVDDFLKNVMRAKEYETEDKALEWAFDVLSSEAMFISALKQYVMNKSYERKVILKESKAENRSDSGSGDKKHSVRLKNVDKKPVTQFLLDDIVEYIACGKRKNGYSCECWDVRGHFRHYKNGKVSWIPPYEKGKQRRTGMNRGGKTYTLS